MPNYQVIYQAHLLLCHLLHCLDLAYHWPQMGEALVVPLWLLWCVWFG